MPRRNVSSKSGPLSLGALSVSEQVGVWHVISGADALAPGQNVCLCFVHLITCQFRLNVRARRDVLLRTTLGAIELLFQEGLRIGAT